MRNFSVEIDIEAERDRKQNLRLTLLTSWRTNEWQSGLTSRTISVGEMIHDSADELQADKAGANDDLWLQKNLKAK